MPQSPNSLQVCIRFSPMVSSCLVHWYAARFFCSLPLREANIICPSGCCRAETHFKLQAPVSLSDSACRLPVLWCVEEKNIQGTLRLCFAFQPMGLGSRRKSRGCCFWASLKHPDASDSDAARATSSYGKTDGLPAICFPSWTSQNRF